MADLSLSYFKFVAILLFRFSIIILMSLLNIIYYHASILLKYLFLLITRKIIWRIRGEICISLPMQIHCVLREKSEIGNLKIIFEIVKTIHEKYTFLSQRLIRMHSLCDPPRRRTR